MSMHNKNDFSRFIVVDNGLESERIMKGDTIVVDHRSSIIDGNLVLARVNGELIIRRVSLHNELYKIICPSTRNVLDLSVEIVGNIVEIRFKV